MQTKIEVLHLKGLRKGLKEEGDKMTENMVKTLHKAAYMVEVPAARKATRLFDHPTGNLPTSIHSEVIRPELTARVGTNLEYAALREFGGTVTRAWGRAVAVHTGRPFLHPAFREAIPQIEKLFKEQLDDMVSSIESRTEASR